MTPPTSGEGNAARRNLDDFTRRAGQFNREVKEKEAAQFERAVRESGFGPGHTAVDMGIGTGNAALPFLKAGGRVIGVELTPAMAQKGAKRLAREGFTRRTLHTIAAAERAPIGGGAADAAVCRNVFHHFEDPRAVFAEMARTVRPGGHVFVIDFYDPEDEAEREILNRCEFLRVPSHVRTLALSEFRVMYESAGFRLFEPMTCASRTRFADWMKGTTQSSGDYARILADMEGLRDAGGGWWSVEGEGDEMHFTRKRVILAGRKD